MTVSPFRAAILDLDGVMTQTATRHARTWKPLFDADLRQRGAREGESHLPFALDADDRQDVAGQPRDAGVQRCLRSRGMVVPLGAFGDQPGRETVRGLGHRTNASFPARLRQDGVAVDADPVEAIGACKRDGGQGAVRAASRHCEALLRAARRLDLCAAKGEGHDREPLRRPGKPAPAMVRHAARPLGVDEALAGVRAARAGRCGRVVGVARQRAGHDVRQAGADVVGHDRRQPQSASPLQAGAEPRHHPASALEHADRIATRMRRRALVLCLDYDGTLTPIVRRPEAATLSDAMRALLRQLAEYCTVAIVSGRDRRDAEAMVQVDTLVYAGSHGFDIRGPGGLALQHEAATQRLPDLDAAERTLRQRIADLEGAHVERKRFAVAVHYREVADAEVGRVEAAVDAVCAAYSRVKKKGGKKVFELQPDVDWDKGRAVVWLAQSLGLDEAGAGIIYIGDDVTDEDAFRALRHHAAGVGIRVGLPGSSTHATYYLRDCDEVQQFLQWLLALLKQETVAQ